MTTKRIVAIFGSGILGLAGIMVGVGPASATDRPVNVAFVRAWPKQILHHDGTVTARASVRCKKGWSPAELDMSFNQGESIVAGFTVPTITCDNRWHGVTFKITDVPPGALHTGKVLVSSQFLITNNYSGDSAGGHDVQRPAHLRHRHH